MLRVNFFIDSYQYREPVFYLPEHEATAAADAITILKNTKHHAEPVIKPDAYYWATIEVEDKEFSGGWREIRRIVLPS